MEVRQDRECGTCNACCKTHSILELAKPARVWCRYVKDRHGCKIYGTHPRECKDFACQWLLGGHSEDERPDQIKIVLDYFDLPGIGWVDALFEVAEGVMSSKFVENETISRLAQGVAVLHLPIKGNNKLFLPKNISMTADYFICINGKETDVVFE